MTSSDISQSLANQVTEAFETRRKLSIVAGGSKSFYGNTPAGDAIDVSRHRGIIEYQPSELVLTARAGTPLAEIETLLADNGQMLAFEPPMHTPAATFGGAIACGLSGPRRAFSGSARDFVLGTRIINGKGEILKFGGQVMKNVAGYDASRLMCGAQGTLGILLDISVKVLPRPERELTLSLSGDAADLKTRLNAWMNAGLPLSASCSFGSTLIVRLSSTPNSVEAAARTIGGEHIDDEFWNSLRNQSHDHFLRDKLWRVSVPPATPELEPGKPQLREWGEACRWISTETDMHELASRHGGHATRYQLKQRDADDCFQPLAPSMLKLHKRIKTAFDPAGILNNGRLYRGL